MSKSRTEWIPGGLAPKLAGALAVDQPGTTPMTFDLYRELLRRKLDSLIQADPKEARWAMEMSVEHAPGLWAIAHQNPMKDWAALLVASDEMKIALSPLTMQGSLRPQQPLSLLEILELLA